jgi:alpha-mannosidase
MMLRRASILLPCDRLENFPTHLGSQEAADLLAGWTALWHPSLIAATGRLPGWHPADSPPDPGDLEGELIVVPTVSRQRLAGDWCDRLRATVPNNPPTVEACTSRDQTISAIQQAAEIVPDSVAAEVAADFLALGFAHLQVELLTRAMRYSTVLDTEQFTDAVVAAARSAATGDSGQVGDELGRAFDLLADARNHVYAVDYYVVDVTLVAATTLGESLRKKLATGVPCNLLVSGELIEQMAREHPDTLAALRTAIDQGTACVLGGPFSSCGSRLESPEALLASLKKTQQSAAQHLGHECQIFGQFHSAFSPLLPEILSGLGFRGALHASFDGGRLPRAEQCKTRWGQADGAWIEAVSATPLDATRPETWLKFAEHVGDSIAHDHVATVVLAGWPGQSCEYFDDLRRAAKFNPVLGKLITLEEYFRVTRETDDWTTFAPREYPQQSIRDDVHNPVSSQLDTYRGDACDVYQKLATGLSAVASAAFAGSIPHDAPSAAVLNPWNFAVPRFLSPDLLDPTDCTGANQNSVPSFVSDVPGCGYAQPQAPPTDRILLADGHKLQNEFLELTVSVATGGIQSLRTHRDRNTRVSQRLIYYKHRRGRDLPTLDTKMIAEHIEITRNDGVLGEITSRGQLLDAADELLARFTQTVRLARGMHAVIVDIQLEPLQPPEGELWNAYFASRLAWSDEAVSFRRGVQWQAHETGRERIESPEFVEISNGVGKIVCFALGLPFHRRPSTTWLDTLLCVAGESRRQFQFALGLDCTYPVQAVLALLTADSACKTTLPYKLPHSHGWFLHVGARNLLVTHLELLPGERTGICCRILETEGRQVETTLAAYRPFHAARTTDFRANDNEVLSIVDGQVQFTVGPHRWIQIEAEW